MDDYSQPAAELLEEAADLIENVGHCRGELVIQGQRGENGEKRTVAYCLLGAIYAVTSPALAITKQVAIQEVAREIQHRTSWPLSDSPFLAPLVAPDIAMRWNDTYAEDGAEVVDVMRHAAKNLRNQVTP
jgi:hypothetical protein